VAAAGLRMAIALTRRRAGLLLHPPGASPYLALWLALSGLEAGLTTPDTVAEIRAVRMLFTDGWETFASAWRSLPSPSTPALVVSALLVGVALFSLGGWINAFASLVRGEEPDGHTWNEGILRSGRATVFAMLAAVTAVVLLLVTLIGAAVLRMAVSGQIGNLSALLGPAAHWLPANPTLVLAGLAALLMALAIAVAVSAVSQLGLMAVVAILESRAPIWQVPALAARRFGSGARWHFASRWVAILAGWYGLKLALLQLIIPFRPVDGLVSRGFAVVGAVLNGALTVGDGAIALLILVIAVQVGVEQLQQ